MPSIDNTLVTGPDGLRGRLIGPHSDLASLPELVAIELDGGRRIEVPSQLLQVREDGRLFLPMRPSELEAGHISRPAPEETVILPVIAEALQIDRQTIETGRLRIRKTVREHTEIVDEPLLHEHLRVERVAIDRLCEGPTPATRQEGNVLIVPVLEEVLVVEKRLRLKEEWHIIREQETIHAPQKVTLSHEEVHIDRLSGATENA